jgi:hypothetical protein
MCIFIFTLPKGGGGGWVGYEKHFGDGRSEGCILTERGSEGRESGREERRKRGKKAKREGAGGGGRTWAMSSFKFFRRMGNIIDCSGF